MLKVKVIIYKNAKSDEKVAEYIMDHDDKIQRSRLGAGCRDAFEAGQKVETYPV